ncbi:CAP domain-containing protein [Metabacillus litoralis]|uniref:CAP domain-containing protein n=1 Tax=Metabacillus litoralis TaxID=152268 RepID=UPI000AFDB46F
MINKKFSMFVTGALVAGLVACNNNNEALDTTDVNRVGTVDVSDNVNYNGRSYGPITRDIGTRYNEGANELRTAHRDRQNTVTENDFDLDFIPDRNGNIDGMDLSSSKTDVSSNKYPHTRAIAVQEARFKTIQANSPEEAQQKAQQYINQFKQQAEQRAPQAQQRTQQNQVEAPPTQQQPKAQAPQEQKQQAPTQQQQQAKAPAEKQPETQQPTQGLSQAVQQVIELTNAERRKNGLSDLKGDTKLSGVAQKKSEDMRQNHYFSHTSPTYGSPFDMMRDFGVTYKTAGENIAQGQQTPEQVVQAWMNSEGHRKNILSKDFTHIGVGYDQNGHHWTQMFIGK